MKTRRTAHALRAMFLGHIVINLLALLLLPRPGLAQTCSEYTATGGINWWPQGRIPYVFDADFPESGKPAIRAAATEWMKSGGAIAFVEYASYSSGPYVRIKPVTTGGESSDVGPRVPTVTNLRTTTPVGGHSHVLHELGHAIGFPHEQARPDRFAFVSVQTNNILPSFYPPNFAVVPWECWPPRTISTSYDYRSIMHYDWCLGSVKGCGSGTKGVDDTMFAVDTSVQYSEMGKWVGDTGTGLSAGDKTRIQTVYGKAIWVDRNSPCIFDSGAHNCDFPATTGAYKLIPDAIAAVTIASPVNALMIKTGTYSRGTVGTLRIDKPMRLVAWQNAVRIE